MCEWVGDYDSALYQLGCPDTSGTCEMEGRHRMSSGTVIS